MIQISDRPISNRFIVLLIGCAVAGVLIAVSDMESNRIEEIHDVV